MATKTITIKLESDTDGLPWQMTSLHVDDGDEKGTYLVGAQLDDPKHKRGPKLLREIGMRLAEDAATLPKWTAVETPKPGPTKEQFEKGEVKPV